MIRCHFDLFSSRGKYIDKIGDDFTSIDEARRMSRALLLDYAQHKYANGEGCLIVCKWRTTPPVRYYLTSLAVLDGAIPAGGSPSSEQIDPGAVDDGNIAYRMSADWTDLCELRSDGFLKAVRVPDRSWFMNYIPREERPRVAAAIDQAIQFRAPFNLEHRVIRADETIGWAVSRALPVVDEHGRIHEWIGVAKDVTAKHTG